jgi:hypothetical protein
MSDYLKFRFEQHRIERERPGWLSKFQTACCPEAQESDFLPGDEAAALRQSFYQKLREGVGIWSKEFQADDRSDVLGFLGRVGQRLDKGMRAVLLETDVGAIDVPVASLLTNAGGIWEPARHDFCVVSRDMRNGLCAEQNPWQGPGLRHDQPYFEMRAWGSFAPQEP